MSSISTAAPTSPQAGPATSTLEEERLTPPAAGAAAPDAPARLRARGLSLWYGSHQALRSVDVSMLDRQITAIIGPSGCGKSTLLRCFNRMNDLYPPIRYEGSVLVDGQDVLVPGTDLVDLRRRVGMVFQRANPFPMSTFQNVAYGPRLLGVRDRRRLEQMVESALRRAALWDEVKDRLSRPAFGLSGGQQQRLCIARALAVGPEVLLLDEPASALDPTATAKIEELLVEIKKEVTVAIVTHNMQQAARISDRTAFIMQGALIEEGLTRTLFTQPKQRLTEDYITGRFG
ncbi:MAG TPA: phosphate ABC transporter ATP-binding protein PstB [Candidatus Eisenbacteria bacterium]|jgi:phosphate transport system ATP-binding protein